MLNETRKDFNAVLNARKDMPKIQIITDPKAIAAYGGDRMYFVPPIDYDRAMRRVPFGKLLTVGDIRSYLARRSGADFTEPLTAGLFVSIAAWASHQRAEDKIPYWRTLKTGGELNEKIRGAWRLRRRFWKLRDIPCSPEGGSTCGIMSRTMKRPCFRWRSAIPI